MKIKIKVAKAQENQLKNKEIAMEVKEVQKLFDTSNFSYSNGTVNFVILKGIYSHIKRSMCVIGVYVNKSDSCIWGLGCTLDLKFRNIDAKIMTADIAFPTEFIGSLDIDEGLLIHLDVPVIGLSEDAVYDINDITGELSNVKLIKKST